MRSLPECFGRERTEVVDKSSFLSYTTVAGKVKQAFDFEKT